MKASIVIPNLNGAGWAEGLHRIHPGTDVSDFELIVVDNGSEDESLAIARSYVGQEGYTLIENGRNTGFSHAVNQGIRAAKGEYVVLFNNDAFAKPQWLEELVAMAGTDEKIFAVQSLMIRHFERELADDAGDYVTLFGWACKRGDGMYWKRYTKPQRIFSACGGASLYRKCILDEIGLFDETFFAYFEDVDISWRANSLGYKNMYCPAAKCYHICGATTRRCALQCIQKRAKRAQQHSFAVEEYAVFDVCAEFSVPAGGVPAEGAGVRPARLLEAVTFRRKGGSARHSPLKKAEVPPAQCALLCVNRAVAGCRCVPLYRLPRRPCAEMEIALAQKMPKAACTRVHAAFVHKKPVGGVKWRCSRRQSTARCRWHSGRHRWQGTGRRRQCPLACPLRFCGVRSIQPCNSSLQSVTTSVAT